MPIVIARSGECAPVATPLSQDQKNAAWSQIVTAWVEKHPDLFQAMLQADELEPQQRCTA